MADVGLGDVVAELEPPGFLEHAEAAIDLVARLHHAYYCAFRDKLRGAR